MVGKVNGPRKLSTNSKRIAFHILLAGIIGGLLIDVVHFIGLAYSTEMVEAALLLVVPLCLGLGMFATYALRIGLQSMVDCSVEVEDSKIDIKR
jgi:hypothetical protein